MKNSKIIKNSEESESKEDSMNLSQRKISIRKKKSI